MDVIVLELRDLWVDWCHFKNHTHVKMCGPLRGQQSKYHGRDTAGPAAELLGFRFGRLHSSSDWKLSRVSIFQIPLPPFHQRVRNFRIFIGLKWFQYFFGLW